MTNIFHAVGEHRDDPNRLLLLGDDGRAYEHHLPDGEPRPTDLDRDDWVIDPDVPRNQDAFVWVD